MIVHINFDNDTLVMLDGLCEAFHKTRDQVMEDALVYYSNACKPIDELIRALKEEAEEGGED